MFRGTWKTISDKYSNKCQVTSFHLHEGKLCPDCDIVFAFSDSCPRCGSQNFYLLAKQLGENLGTTISKYKFFGCDRTHSPKM